MEKINNIWFISDTHFGHSNILGFKREDGSLLRHGFKTINEMDERIFDLWNETVKHDDKVYHLGDVAFDKKVLLKMKGLPGSKRLIRGNHDLFKKGTYLEVFNEIYGVRQMDGYWLTHVPMHPSCIEYAKLNIHGHLHYKRIPSNKYVNVCVENTNYAPINFEDIKLLWNNVQLVDI